MVSGIIEGERDASREGCHTETTLFSSTRQTVVFETDNRSIEQTREIAGNEPGKEMADGLRTERVVKPVVQRFKGVFQDDHAVVEIISFELGVTETAQARHRSQPKRGLRLPCGLHRE